jgi:hypothetical protein
MCESVHPALCPVWQSLWFFSPHHVFHTFYCLKYKVYHHTQQFNTIQQCATCSVHQNHHRAPLLHKCKNTSTNVIEVPHDGSDQLKHVVHYCMAFRCFLTANFVGISVIVSTTGWIWI